MGFNLAEIKETVRNDGTSVLRDNIRVVTSKENVIATHLTVQMGQIHSVSNEKGILKKNVKFIV